ncbi:hypothetical protein [Gordonibacter pamelaeae]|uniref:hypothetical protein n=1 Tax=Gordonibacter pamelaeae TaxID=471189 RepID=UPI001D068334|nr:hypothetical protein [Gordonibacter pamelaeae]MCB6312358.1 hypothetical protein [Gordonibacter pamelaeae]
MTKTSRFNYIKRGLVGVCAATMLTGLCAGTAFADQSATKIYTLDTSAAQISVTVPTGNAGASLNAAGALTLPDLVLTNESLAPVYISKVEVSGVNTSINLLTEADYTDATKGAVNNATKISMAADGKSIDLGAFKATGGATIQEADAVTIAGNSGKATLSATASMKNFTGSILGQSTLDFMTVSFTVAPTTA